MHPRSTLDWVTFILLIIGGLNWLLVGLFGLDLVVVIFGTGSILSSIIYIIIGLSAIYILIRAFMGHEPEEKRM